MRGGKAEMLKMGAITQKMCRDFKNYNVTMAFAYNSGFDEKVFDFICEWYKIKNPFDTIPIYDIRGYVHNFIAFDKAYQDFCEKHSLFTESGNYSTTAESVFRFFSANPDFVDEHTALADAEIELEILQYCIDLGGQWGTEYKVYRTIPRNVQKVLEIKASDGNIYKFSYKSLTDYKEKNNKKKIKLRG
jgi:hypothetical protein